MCFRSMPAHQTALRWRSACGRRSLPATSYWTRAGWKPKNPPPIRPSRRTSSRITWRKWTRRTSGSSIRSTKDGVLSVLSVLFVLSAPLTAQTVRVAGAVLSADSMPVPGVRLVLHRVSQQVQGPIDSARSDRRGRFSFAYRADTSAFYLVSGRYAGIEYFSSPLPTNPARADNTVRVVVYDTSSTAPVSLEARHLVLTRPGEDGSRSILDLVILRNAGRLTRVAPDTVRGSWSVQLPRGTVGLQVRESDVSSDAM